ncbi:MAG: VCBS repeat-containing protein [Planctomycetota bacterium]
MAPGERLQAAAGAVRPSIAALLACMLHAPAVFAQGAVFVERRVPTPFIQLYAGAAADFDGDGDLDFMGVTTDLDDNLTVENTQLVLFTNDGSASPNFTVSSVEPLIGFESQQALSDLGLLIAADLDNDGDVDLAFDNAFVLANDGLDPPSFARFDTPTSPNGLVAVADLDNDQDLDLIYGTAWRQNLGGSPPVFEATTRSTGVLNSLPADINNDGLLDMVRRSPNAQSGATNWARNDGASPPTFIPGNAIPPPPGGSLGITLVGDLDSDGDDDLISIELAYGDPDPSNRIRVALNDGSQPAAAADPAGFVEVTAASGAGLDSIDEFVRMGDFDGDGDNDLAVGGDYYNDNAATWFENVGGNTLEQRDLGVLDAAALYTIGDLEGDGDLDLVALVGTNGFTGGIVPEPPGTIVLFQQADDVVNLTSGVPSASFAEAVALALPGDVLETDPSRFFGDPDIDLAGKALKIRSTADIRQPSAGTWLLSDGAEIESASGSTVLSGSVVVPANADAVIRPGSDATFESSVMLGADGSLLLDGDASFAAATPVEIATIAQGPQVESYQAYRTFDPDGDGDLEIFIIDLFGQNGAAILDPVSLDPLTYTFVPLPGLPAQTRVQEAVDINLDGADDLLIDGQVYLSDGGSPPTFTPVTLPGGGTLSLAADFDQDGRIDLLDRGPGWIRNTSDDLTAWTQRISIGIGEPLAIGDFDGDGDHDVFTGSSYFNDGNNTEYGIFENSDGKGQVWIGRNTNFELSPGDDVRTDGELKRFLARDLDGDGDDDLLPLWRQRGLSEWFESDGNFPTVFTRRLFGSNATAARVLDFDNDGDLDILGGAGTGAAAPEYYAALFENDGGQPPKFEERLFRPDDPIPMNSMAIGDLDNDGDDDIVAGDSYTYYSCIAGVCGESIRVLLAGDPLPLALDQPNTRLETTAALSVEKGELWLAATTSVAAANGVTLDGQAASLTGSGTIEGPLTNAGRIEPDVGAALTVTGDFTQTTGVIRTRLEADGLGGVRAGVLAAQQAATLDGTLIISPDPALDPALGDTGLDLISAQTALNGVFDVVLISPALPGSKFLLLDYAQNPIGGREGRRAGGAVGLAVQSLGSVVDLDPPSSFTVTGAPTDADVADLNGDGFDDLAFVIPSLSNPITGPGSLVVLYSDGAGGFDFAEQIIVNTGANPQGVAIGDLDGAGGLDIAVSNAEDDSIIFYTNDGAGTMTSLTAQPPITSADVLSLDEPLGIVIAQIDGVGNDDIAFVSSGSDVLTILENMGALTFEPCDIPVGPRPKDLDDTDVDANGAVDLVVANSDPGAPSIEVVRQDGPLIFTTSRIALAAAPEEILTGPFNGDAFPEIVTVNPGGNTVSVLRNLALGDGAFAPPADLPIGDNPTSITALDADSDAAMDLDLAIVATNAMGDRVVQILRNDTVTAGQLVFALSDEINAGDNPALVRDGDLDGDARDDLITLGDAPPLPPPGPPPGPATISRVGSVPRTPVNNLATRLNVAPPIAPCSPADITTDGLCTPGAVDGAVTLSDFSCYLSEWSTGAPTADITTTGVCNPGTGTDGVDLSDFSCYLSTWSAGCP